MLEIIVSYVGSIIDSRHNSISMPPGKMVRMVDHVGKGWVGVLPALVISLQPLHIILRFFEGPRLSDTNMNDDPVVSLDFVLLECLME